MSFSRDSPVLPKLQFADYYEDGDFRKGISESDSRSQTVIYRVPDKKWWIKITVEGAIPCSSCDIRPQHVKSFRERCNKLQDFIKTIDFQSLALLDDTVTEIILNEDTRNVDFAKLCLDPKVSNPPPSLIGNMRYLIREDPMRVRYPPATQFPSLRPIRSADLIKEVRMTPGVFRVRHKFENKQYVLKEVKVPGYIPQDTNIILQELANLEQFKGTRGIAQPAGISVFTSPYATCSEIRQPMVINGILVEFYRGGTLAHVLRERSFAHLPWQNWALQIGISLDNFHRAGKTHMDLKTANIVLGECGNAIIIDISGIGGTTHGWQAPETAYELSPLGLPFEARRLNDFWAFGKVVQAIASSIEDCPFKRTLDRVSGHLMDDVATRWSLSEALPQLSISD
ncbi:hypothetical protein N7466_006049 [Penicillium verhagenii]|uniref:uncharacterized protein n=1 Tax=Penicillium verhagenii TaxID=1562060 RepID=UPI00254545BE|nr:uncharacterized protein N7466_006049 [Penicillium verhagenii]KAJ5930556.1 hypothetical protein N7466_006049 [Penicillium verhagenii]